MDLKYYALGAVILLALIFISKLWKLLLFVVLAVSLYWYFLVR